MPKTKNRRVGMQFVYKLTIVSILSLYFIISFTIYSEADSKRNSHKTMNSLFIMQKLYDSNNDGNITKSEMSFKAKNAINNFDSNKDGALSLEEFKTLWTKRMNRRMVRHFQRLDHDGNAMISLKEINNGVERVMWKMDNNNDGIISKNDLPSVSRRNIRGHRFNNISNRPG